MTKYLLDTNLVSELRKTRPHAAVILWLQSLSIDQIFISAVSLGELQTGVELTRKQGPAKASEIETWLNSVEESSAFISMHPACFREWARLTVGKAKTLREDAMIAATAKIHRLTVATRDEKDFKHLGVEFMNPFKVH